MRPFPEELCLFLFRFSASKHNKSHPYLDREGKKKKVRNFFNSGLYSIMSSYFGYTHTHIYIYIISSNFIRKKEISSTQAVY